MTLSKKVLVPRGTAYSIREAVIGFDDHGRMVFYYPEDVHLDDNEHYAKENHTIILQG